MAKMTTTSPQTIRLSADSFKKWKYSTYVFTIATVLFLLTPTKYLPGFIRDELGDDAVVSALTIAGILLAVFGLFNALITILILDVLLFIALKTVGYDVAFRDVNPVLRRSFFVSGCGLLMLSGYLFIFGKDWSIYNTFFPALITVLTIVVHVTELYRSLSEWGIPEKGKKITVVALYCAIPAIFITVSFSMQNMVGL